MLIYFCECVYEAKNRFQTSCLKYEELTSNCIDIRQELTIIIRKSVELNVEFSAAGFYNINRTVFSMIFSTVTTYLIILMQLNMYT